MKRKATLALVIVMIFTIIVSAAPVRIPAQSNQPPILLDGDVYLEITEIWSGTSSANYGDKITPNSQHAIMHNGVHIGNAILGNPNSNATIVLFDGFEDLDVTISIRWESGDFYAYADLSSSGTYTIPRLNIPGRYSGNFINQFNGMWLVARDNIGCPPCECILYEWVQVWAAGAYNYERNYHKRDLMQREYGVHRLYNVERLWSRSNPSNSFGPPSAPNNVAFGDDEFTGIGLFVNGISFRFGHGPGDYRNIYRQPNREIPDLTITEVTWNWRWHYEAVRVYLYNVELYDGTMLDRYFLGEVFNKVYDDRNPDNPKGGYIEDGFSYEFRVDGNFIHTDIWFPPHIYRASSLRLVDFTDSIHNWSTARNGCPIENIGPNPHRTYTRYCDGFDVDAMSTWYRRSLPCICDC